MLGRGLELVREFTFRPVEPLLRVELAELAKQLGDEDGRQRELREAHRLLTEIGAIVRAERLAGELATPTA